MSVELTIPQVDKLGKAGTDFLGVRYPLISGGMTWISDSSLVKAVHDCGGFGVLAAGNMPPEIFEDMLTEAETELTRVKELL